MSDQAARRSIITALFITLLPMVFGEPCPSLAAQAAGDQAPLDLNHFSAYVIVNTSDSQASGSGSGLDNSPVELIRAGEVSAVFSSASSATEIDSLHFSTSITPLPILLQLNSTAPEPVYYLFNTWSLNTAIASAGCPARKAGQLGPGDEFMNKVNVSCVGEGEVVIQGCLTLGTAPFDALIGTYKTLEFYFLHRCEGFTDSTCEGVRARGSVVPGELCLTLNQSQQLVTNPVGSWGVLLNPLRPNREDPLRGYCVIDEAVEGGLATFAADPALRPLFPVAEIFPALEMYVGIVSGAKGLAFSILFTSTNTSILDPPYILPITAGVPVERETIIYLNLPCVGPGFVEVQAVMNMSTILNETLYFQSYLSSIFKNCTPATTNSTTPVSRPPDRRSTNTIRVRLLAGLLPGLLFLLITLTAVLVMILLTRRIIRRKTVTLQRLDSMDNLSSNNAYTLKTVKSPYDCLKELGMEYNYPSLEVVSELGEGAFGRVFKATAPGLERHGFVPAFVAVKTLKDASSMSEEFCKEVKAVARFNHPNIVRLLAICSTTAQKCMIFEYMDLGSLDNLLRKSDPENAETEVNDKREDGIFITPSEFLNFSLQVARGMAYLAELKYIHRDIASRNCLVNTHMVVKIGDFGLSRDLSSMDYYRVGGTQACLPVRWMPPEALLFGKFTTQSDVWSFGVLMWEIFTFGRRPYTGLSNYEVIDAVKASRILECPKLCPASVYDIMKICWTRSPLKRPNMDVVVARLERLVPAEAQGERGEGRQGPDGCVVYINLEYGAQVDTDELEESARMEKELSTQITSGEGPAKTGEVDANTVSVKARSESCASENSASSEVRDIGEVHTRDVEVITEPRSDAGGNLESVGNNATMPKDCISNAQNSRKPDNIKDDNDDNNDDEITRIIGDTHT